MARTRRRPEQNPEPEVVEDPDALEAAEVEVAELDVDQDPELEAAETSETFDGFEDEAPPRRSSAKRPAEPRGRSRRAGTATAEKADDARASGTTGSKESKDSTSPKSSEGSKAAKEPRSSRRRSIEVPDAAKDAPAARSARARSSAEAQRARTDRRRVAAVAPNPAWLAPTAVGLLIAGLVYLVTYYLSGAALPLPIGDWNILVGFGIMIAGGGLLMRWK